MKKLFAFILLIGIINTAFSNNKVLVNSKIKNVTVFLNGAQVYRNANIRLKKGMTDIVFNSISSNIQPNSIQVTGNGNYTILDTKYEMVQPATSNLPPKIPESILQSMKELEDSLDYINFDLEEIKFRQEVLSLERQLLIDNKSIKSDSLALLKDAMAFFREKYNNINSILIKIKKDEYRLHKNKNVFQKRLDKIKVDNAKTYVAKPTYPKYQIIVTVSSDAVTSGNMNINYLVNNASWSPTYDIRTSGVNKPVELTYKANIYQNSGENWDNIQLKLSTNNPNKSKVKPILPVWYLNYYTPQRVTRSDLSANYDKKYAETLSQTGIVDDDELEEKLAPAQTSAYYSTMNENLTNIEFSLSIPYTIPSDGENHLVAIKNDQLIAKYQYHMVPKLDRDAFLVADIKGFEKLNLLPAKATVYFEGTFIGETMINPNVMGDSLAVTLGRDERISIRRKLIKEENKENLLGENKIKNYTYELSLKNNRINNVAVIVEDHIPVPNHKDIKVDLINDSNAKYTKETGLLTWSFNLTSKQSKKIEFQYSVKHHKNKQIALK